MTLLRILALAAAVLGPALPAAAALADPTQRCRDLIDKVAYAAVGRPGEDGRGAVEEPAVGTVTPLGKTGCRYTDVLVGGSVAMGGGWSPQWKVETLVLDQIDFDRYDAGRLPLTLSIRADGVRTYYGRRMPADIAYQLRLLQAPLGIALDYSYDPSADVLTVERFSFGNDRIGHLSATAELAGLNPERIDPAWPSGGDALSAGR